MSSKDIDEEYESGNDSEYDTPQENFQAVKSKRGRPKKDKSLTKEQEDFLNNLYYEKSMLFGRDRIYAFIRDNHPEIKITKRQVNDFLKKQEVNQIFTPTKTTKYTKPTILNDPFNQVAIDLADMQNKEHNGYKYILTGIDLFSKKGYAVPIKNKEGKTVAKAFKDMLAQMLKKPATIRHDVGSEFKDKNFQKVVTDNGIKQIFSQAGKPWSNGGVERFNATLKRQIEMYLTQHNEYDWVSFLPQFLTNYNSTVSSVTKISPNELERDLDDEDILDQVHNNIRDAVVPKNQDIEKPRFKIGDKVRLKLKKDKYQKGFMTFTQEGYTIARRGVPTRNTGAVWYQVISEDGELFSERFYNNDLMLYIEPEKKIEKEQLYEISKIVKPVMVKKGNQYIKSFQVSWKGYQGQDTIESMEQLMEDIPKVVQLYVKKYEVEWTKTGVRYVK